MGQKTHRGSSGIPVCLVEHNPLAERHLRQILRRDRRVRLLSQDEVFASRGILKAEVLVFVLDPATLPTPLHRYLQSLRLRFPQAKTIVLDDANAEEKIFRLLSAGIEGIVSYGDAEHKLLAAIRKVHEGHLWIAPEVLEKYVEYAARPSRGKRAGKEILTEREKQVAELVERLSNKEIGSNLRISQSTVKFHLANIFGKLGVRSRHSIRQTLALLRAEG